MRVISGTAGGRKLLTPENYDIRPTTDIVKESVFNIIQFDVPGCRFLDLFAGTGQMGIEALSRGAEHCTFVDGDKAAINIVKANLKTCGLEGRVLMMPSISFLQSCGEKFDIIYVDPPYDAGLYEPVMKNITEIDILNDSGIIVCEMRKTENPPEVFPPYRLRKEYKYGRLKLAVYVKDI